MHNVVFVTYDDIRSGDSKQWTTSVTYRPAEGRTELLSYFVTASSCNKTEVLEHVVYCVTDVI